MIFCCPRRRCRHHQHPAGQTISHWQAALDRTSPSAANRKGNAALANDQSLNLYVVKFTRNRWVNYHRRYCFGSYWCFSNLDLRCLHLSLRSHYCRSVSSHRWEEHVVENQKDLCSYSLHDASDLHLNAGSKCYDYGVWVLPLKLLPNPSASPTNASQKLEEQHFHSHLLMYSNSLGFAQVKKFLHWEYYFQFSMMPQFVTPSICSAICFLLNLIAG